MATAATASPVAGDGHPPVRLADVLARLDRGLVDAVGTVDPLEVTGVRGGIWDAADDSPLTGAALLMPGFEGTGQAAATVIASLAARGATVVLVRADQVVEEMLAAAEEAGMAVLAVEPRLSWDRLFVLISAALASAELAESAAPGQQPQRGDLFALADGIAAAVGGNTIIGDGQNRVLAYSNLGDPTDSWRRDTILGRTPPEEWIRRFRDEGIYDRMRRPGEVVRFEIEGEERFRPRRAVGVHAAGRMIGAIAVAQGERPFDAETDRVLLDAARLAAMHLLRYESRHMLRQHAQEERLRGVLTGEEDVRAAVARMGLPREGPFVVAAVAVRGGGAVDPLALPRVWDFIRMRWPSGLDGAQAVVDDRLYLLLCGGPLDADRILHALDGMVDGGARLVGAPLVAGLGDEVVSAEEIARSRDAADAVLDILLTDLPDTPAATLDHVWPRVVIRRLEAAVSTPEAMRLGKAARLHHHDVEHGTDLAESLRVLLEETGDVRAAAERLRVHPNTLRYRIRRALEISGIDLRDPVDRLVAEVQLHSLAAEVPPT